MKVGGLVDDPLQKAPYLRPLANPVRRAPDAGKLCIGELGMKRAVANRVDGDGDASPLGFGHRMMPLHPRTQRALA